VSKIKLGDSGQTIEVDLWGAGYTAAPLTKSVIAKVEKAQQRLEAADSSNQTVKAVGALLDVRLVPTNGAGPPSKLVQEKWDADELSMDQLLGFWQNLAEAGIPT
jgi:hypothetical protein